GPRIGCFRGATLEEAEAAELNGAAEIAAGYAAEHKPAAPDGTVARAINEFLASQTWAAYAEKTRKAWRRWLLEALERWGHLSGPEFAAETTAEAVGAWCEEIGKTSPANAVKAKEAV